MKKTQLLIISAISALVFSTTGCYGPSGYLVKPPETWGLHRGAAAGAKQPVEASTSRHEYWRWRKPVKPSAFAEERRKHDWSESMRWPDPGHWHEIPDVQDYSRSATKPRPERWQTNRRLGASSQVSKLRKPYP